METAASICRMDRLEYVYILCREREKWERREAWEGDGERTGREKYREGERETKWERREAWEGEGEGGGERETRNGKEERHGREKERGTGREKYREYIYVEI